MLYRTTNIVVVIAAVLAVCTDVSAQSGSAVVGNNGYAGQSYGYGYGLPNDGFAENSSRYHLHSKRFRNDCGRGITQMQAASLWSNYCNENCGYNGGNQSCNNGSRCGLGCRSGCGLGGKLHVGLHSRGAGCNGGCLGGGSSQDCCDSPKEGCGSKFFGKLKSGMGGHGCGLFSKNRNECGCSEGCFDETTGSVYGDAGNQGSGAVGSGADPVDPPSIVDETQSSLSDPAPGNEIEPPKDK